MRHIMTLKAYGNPDHGQFADVMDPLNYAYDGEDWEDEFREAAVWYRDEHNLGGGNWGPVTGMVFEVSGKGLDYVGRYSYNGRFWPKGSEDELYPPSKYEKLDAAKQAFSKKIIPFLEMKAEYDKIAAEFEAQYGTGPIEVEHEVVEKTEEPIKKKRKKARHVSLLES